MTTDKMLIDAAHPEETRVVVLRGNRIEEFDFESAAKKLLRGNIYLAKITRVEPSLQAAFVDYGGNRHGFLAFSEIHPDYYQIPVADRQALIREEAEAVAEEARREASDPYTPPELEANSEDAEPQDPADTEVEEAGGGSVPWDVEDAVPMPLHGAEGSHDGGDARALERRDPVVHGSLAVADIVHQAEQSVEAAQPSHEIASLPEAEPISTVIEQQLQDQTEAAATSHALSREPFAKSALTAADAHPDSNGRAPTSADAPASEDVVEESPERRRRPRRAQYKIQEVIKRRQIILVQVVKEERGNKGAALTTYLSLAGRYTVLMPNTARGGGISRKITNAVDRRRLKEITSELEVPEGMGLIVRTAGASRTTAEIKRDHEYLLRLWESIRDLTLKSTAPALVYEEGSLVKRSIRDLYSKDIDEVVVAGQEAYDSARDFMRMLMPSHAKNVKLYNESDPLFARYQIERQLNAMYSPYVTLKSGGYIVLNQTEALVAIDVNSGKSTREHSIEDTALNTNLEASDEIARQLRLRDLAGLIVIDFIDMDERRNNRAVERRLKEALRFDRARIQVGRISHFGLMEMSRQRLRTGVLEGSTSQCPHCMGTGVIRSTESVALAVLRALEDSLMGHTPRNMVATTSIEAALYLLNEKRSYLRDIEARYGVVIEVDADAQLQGANFRVDATGAATGVASVKPRQAIQLESGFDAEPEAEAEEQEAVEADHEVEEAAPEQGDRRRSRRRRRRRGDRGERPEEQGYEATQNGANGDAGTPVVDDDAGAGPMSSDEEEDEAEAGADAAGASTSPGEGDRNERRGRRRGRRGGRRNRRGGREDRGEALNGQSSGAMQARPDVFAPGAEQPEVRGDAWAHSEPASSDPPSDRAAPRDGSAPASNGHHEPASGDSGRNAEAQTVEAAPRAASEAPPAQRLDDAAIAVVSVFREVAAITVTSEPASPGQPAVAAAIPVTAVVPPDEPSLPPKRGWWSKRFSG